MPAWLQGGEAVLMKNACRMWYTVGKSKGWEFEKVGDIHDEWQTEFNENLIIDTKTLTFSDKDEAEEYIHTDGKIWSAPKKVGADKYQYMYSPLGELQVRALQKAGEKLNLNCPMDGEYIIGNNWFQTH